MLLATFETWWHNYLFGMKLIFCHSQVQCNFSIFTLNKGLLLALLYIALIIFLLIGLKGLQLILEISATYSLVTYLLTDNWPICRLCMQCMISNNNIVSIQVPCNGVFVVIFFKTMYNKTIIR